MDKIQMGTAVPQIGAHRQGGTMPAAADLYADGFHRQMHRCPGLCKLQIHPAHKGIFPEDPLCQMLRRRLDQLKGLLHLLTDKAAHLRIVHRPGQIVLHAGGTGVQMQLRRDQKLLSQHTLLRQDAMIGKHRKILNPDFIHPAVPFPEWLRSYPLPGDLPARHAPGQTGSQS